MKPTSLQNISETKIVQHAICLGAQINQNLKPISTKAALHTTTEPTDKITVSNQNTATEGTNFNLE